MALTTASAQDATVETTEEAEQLLQERLQAGHVIEHQAEMTDRYREVLVATMSIAADLEVMVLGVATSYLAELPSIDDRIAATASLHDEMGHAQVMFRMLADFGFDPYEQVFERDPRKFKSFSLLEWPVQDQIHLALSYLVGDRAGYITTLDLERSCSYGPYARSLRKVNFEEQFHFRRGEFMVRQYMRRDDETRRRVQEAMDFWFPLAVEWFGAVDSHKSRGDQLLYRIRGKSNDQLRQQWLDEVVPFCEEVGLSVPAHFDEDKGRYTLDYELPILFDEETGKWNFETVTWPEKIAAWRRGGPNKLPALERMQSERWGDELW
jgi:ring-1,2-phenylacetyl-CoA epoxidase subunit PaaA